MHELVEALHAASRPDLELNRHDTPADLNEDYTQDQADGQIFFTLTRGKDAMPFYRDALSQEERWDVVNYVKKEFGKK